MNTARSVIVRYEPLRTLAFGGITAVYAAVGTAFTHPIRKIKIVNGTDQNLIISYDAQALVDHDMIPSSSEFIYDWGSNKASQGGNADMPIGSIIWVKTAGLVLPTSGSVYVTAMYLSDK